MIAQIEHMHDAIPIHLVTGTPVNLDGFHERTFGTVLGFNDALKLTCAGFVHSGDLSSPRSIGANKQPETLRNLEGRRDIHRFGECFDNGSSAVC